MRYTVAPVTTRAIVEAEMAVKALPADDARARELIHKTVLGSLNRATDTIERAQADRKRGLASDISGFGCKLAWSLDADQHAKQLIWLK